MSHIDPKLMVFESDPDFSDNSRGLWDYVNENTDYKTCWIVYYEDSVERLTKKGIDCALVGTDKANEVLSKAQFIVSSTFRLPYFRKSDQIHIQLWHGFPLKLIGFFGSANAGSVDFNGIKTSTILVDMLAATSQLSRLTMGAMFAMDPRKVEVTGYPRNDIMLKADAQKCLKEVLGKDLSGSKLIFYLPTMRKGLKAEGAQFSDNFFNYKDYDPQKLNDLLEKHDAYIIAKTHFADNAHVDKDEFALPERMICLDTEDLTSKDLTIYHIAGAFDTLITDYSSIYADFLLLDKPIVFSCPDIDQYAVDRGFVVDDPSLLMPGPICKSQEDLMVQLTDVLEGKDAYKEERKRDMPFFHTYTDADSSKRVFELMEKIKEQRLPDSDKDIAPYFCDSMSPLYPYSRRGEAWVYKDVGDGIKVDQKEIFKFELEKGQSKLHFEFDVDDSVQVVRFDPEDGGRWLLKHISVHITDADGKKKRLPYSPFAYVKKGGYYFPITNDPQLILNLNGKYSGKITVEYECFDVLNDAEQIADELDTKGHSKERKSKLFHLVYKLIKRGA